jgi:ribosomal protein S12 methylthiotransferase accessory factor
MSHTRTFLSPEEIESLVKPFVNNRVGLMAEAVELVRPHGHPDICVYSADLSKMQRLHEHLYMPSRSTGIGGAGSSAQRDVARAKCYCEALERYSNVVYDAKRVIVASRKELGDAAVDLTSFAQGSAQEYQSTHERNIFVPPNNNLPIRWVPGYSLITGEERFVPFVSVYVGAPYQYPGESFMLPISTGSALAASYEQAIVSGICEVVERDALMITWLQSLPLPHINAAEVDHPDFQDRLQRIERGGVKQYFFDATLDLGIPTIYALQINPQARVAALVMASTKLDPIQAMIRVMDEAAPSRLAISNWTNAPHRFKPEDFRTFNALEDGAIYYGDASRLSAFDFLLNSPHVRHATDIPQRESGDVQQDLAGLVDDFRARQLDLFVVDMTPKPIQDIGLCAVKVVAPQLIPLAVDYNLRYTASPRLYDVPPQMGYAAKPAHQLNPNPQPFA